MINDIRAAWESEMGQIKFGIIDTNEALSYNTVEPLFALRTSLVKVFDSVLLLFF